MNATNRRGWQFLLWAALLCAVVWGIKDLPLARIWDTLRQLTAWQISALAALNAVLMLAFSGRWWLILRSMGYRIPYLELAGYRLASFSLSYFTPGPQFGGEPLQVYLLTRRNCLPVSRAAASVTVDKLLELSVNFAFLFLGVFIGLDLKLMPDLEMPGTVLLLCVLVCLPVGYLAALSAGRSPVSWLFTQLPLNIKPQSRLAQLRQAANNVERQAAAFCSTRRGTLVAAILFSVLLWALMIAEYWLALRFLGLSFTPAQAISALAAARIAFLMPFPAGLGALEASQFLAMNALGVDPVFGIAVSLIIRGRDLFIAGLGVWRLALLTHRPLTNPLPPR